MLSYSLLLTFTLIFSPWSDVIADSLSFQSHHQLEPIQEPFVRQDEISMSFIPSREYTLNSTPATLKTKAITVYRPRSLGALHRVRLRSLQRSETEADPLIWDPTQVEGPDVQDLHTLSQLARMAGNAYSLPGKKSWYDVDSAWNKSFPFGWEESDGFRGHVFLSSDNSTVVLSIKGTTLQGPTSRLDKFNDNLLFSCCCARVDISWVFRTVCDCYSGHWRCDNQCLTDALVQDSLFYSVGVKLVDDLRKIYPTANLWLVGHSLGGALASLLGATYGLPAVAFESPGERLAATRLHLPLPPPISLPPQLPSPPSIHTPFWKRQFFPFPTHTTAEPRIPIPTNPSPFPAPDHHPVSTTHVYHTADPIPQGTCTGFGSPCAQAGFALETRCHLGQSIIFDTVGKLGWAVDVRRHVIKEVVHEVLEGDHWWGEDDEDDEVGVVDLESRLGKDKKKKGDDDERKRKRREGKVNVPKAIIEDSCVDCYKWEFGRFKDDSRQSLSSDTSKL